MRRRVTLVLCLLALPASSLLPLAPLPPPARVGTGVAFGMPVRLLPWLVAARFADLFRQVSDQTGASLVPFILEPVALTPELMQDDGIHPTAEAQPLMLETVWPYLQPLLTP